MKILAIGAHPADVFDLAGGTLCKHQINGDDITIDGYVGLVIIKKKL